MLPNRVILSPEALFQELDGEGVILDLNSSSYFGVDGVGARLWHLLQEDPRLGPILQQLLSEYEVERTELEQDVARFIGELSEAGLATVE